MVAKTETEQTGKLDTLKLVVAIALLIAGIAQFYYFEAESLLSEWFTPLSWARISGALPVMRAPKFARWSGRHARKLCKRRCL